MHVIFKGAGEIIVNNMRDVVDVMNDDTAGVRLWCAAAQTVIAMTGDDQLRDRHDRELRLCVERCQAWLAVPPESKRMPRRPRTMNVAPGA